MIRQNTPTLPYSDLLLPYPYNTPTIPLPGRGRVGHLIIFALILCTSFLGFLPLNSKGGGTFANFIEKKTFFGKIRKNFLPHKKKKKKVTGGDPTMFSRKIRHDLSLGFDILQESM